MDKSEAYLSLEKAFESNKRLSDQLLREKFTLALRIQSLTEKLGYRDLEDAEESQLVESQAGPFSVKARLEDALSRIATLEDQALENFDRHQREMDFMRSDVTRLETKNKLLLQQLQDTDSRLSESAAESAKLREEFQERLALKESTITDLRQRIPPTSSSTARAESKENKPVPETILPTPSMSPSSRRTHQRLEYHHDELRKKYDDLLKHNKELSRTFSGHLKGWKNFKVWFNEEYAASAKKHKRGLKLDAQGRDAATALDDFIAAAEKACPPSSAALGRTVLLEHSTPIVAPRFDSLEDTPMMIKSKETKDGVGSMTWPLVLVPDSSPTPKLAEGQEYSPIAARKPQRVETFQSSSNLGASTVRAADVKLEVGIPSIEPRKPANTLTESQSVPDSLQPGRVLSSHEGTETPRRQDDLHIATLKGRALGLKKGRPLFSSLTPKTRSEIPDGLKLARAPETMTEPRKLRTLSSLRHPVSEAGIDADDESPPKNKPDASSHVAPPRPQKGLISPAKMQRHYSTPPESPHSSQKRNKEVKGKPMRRESVSLEIGRDNASASSSKRPAPLIMTKEEREAHFRQLRKLPLHEYKKEYAAFKGRGRYAQRPAVDEDEAINAEYEIDHSRNHGMDQPFEEVVRNKSERRRMHGVDCPCCRDYYEAVGPLPPRLAPPLWKSPTPGRESSPNNGSSQRRTISPDSPSTHRQKAIQDHRQEISRHRHHWVPSSTPPDYWNIGFPDTQQTEEINARAREMNAAKKRFIEEEANKSDGRYKKKRK